ncbi:transglycosylase domain-containing protein [Tenacibaculum sp. 1_MG-2023]|uniref:transglycosylase domain-containing protein n=1 Tax=Tenacibaculum sp. 1_MG-2023 TaxID=3062653 RepID=UPI0026E397AF|nr:transglycosylase domain-containing protein [Tenacibaculum sp. 1_MG-2023]MDO6674388.1 transglycosylase domain-containing protein [Tenacibaculum sp. 1_MG-2023]
MKTLKEIQLQLRENKKLTLLLKYATGFILFGILLVVLLFSLVYFEVFGKLPNKKELTSVINEEASLIYSSDEVIIGKIFAENRTNVQLEQIPNHLKEALIATEDKRFYSHNGYDGQSYARVFFRSILLQDASGGGGSTITQQLIKNLYGRQYHGFLSMPINKIKELIIASRMENLYSKDEILLLYLNSVPFGENNFGVESASNRFFNKSVNELNIEESAVLVGMLKANTYYNPRLNPENAKKRRNTVLQLMNNETYLSNETTDSLQKLPITLNYHNLDINTTAGYFTYQVKKKAAELIKKSNEASSSNYNLETDGLKIHTTLNYDIQKIAEKSAKEQLIVKQQQLDKELASNRLKNRWLKKQQFTEKDKQKRTIQLFDWDSTRTITGNKIDSLWYYNKMLNASVLVTNPKNGAVISWVGGNNFNTLPFDMVLSHRQIASAFKPFLYATALENGISPCDYFENEEKTYPEYDNWEPKNADHSTTPDKKVAMWYALIKSMNIPTVNLYFKLEKEWLIDTCEKLLFPEITDDAPSIALGTLDLSLFEATRAYGSFANNGEMNDLYMISKITDKEGNIIYESKEQKAERVFKKESTQTLTTILQQAVEQGTGAKIRNTYKIKSPLASKTGTAQNYTNAWFMAYTPNIVLGTWVGTSKNDIHFTSGNGSGSSLALPIVANILKEIENNPELRNKYLTSFDIPDEISSLIDCPPYREKGIKGFFNRLFGKKEKE